MKNTIILIVLSSMIIFGFQSCADKINNNPDIKEVSKEVAVEILQAKTNTQYAEPIYKSENVEFLKGEYIQSLPQKMRTQKINDVISEPIMSADEIPFTRLSESTQQIYTDGSFDYVLVDKTTNDMKFIETLNVNPQPENEKVYKTEIKDNTVYLYNSEGALLRTERTGSINFKPMLDSLQAYLASLPAPSTNTPQQVKRIKANKALAQATTYGMRVVNQTENEVVLEMDMGVTKSSIPQRAKSNFTKKAVMRFSPDMTRMYSQKIYEGAQLVQSVEIGFAKDDEPQFSNSLQGFQNQKLPSANIKFIKQKTLAAKPDGTPFIMNNGELYTKNIVKYNFKEK